MIEITREGVAYTIIAVVALGVVIAILATRDCRRREALRRRGIKTYDK